VSAGAGPATNGLLPLAADGPGVGFLTACSIALAAASTRRPGWRPGPLP
jgi:hypothetical protein